MSRRRKVYVPGDVFPVRIRNDIIAEAINSAENASAFVNDSILHYIQSQTGQPSERVVDIDELVSKLTPVIQNIISKALEGQKIVAIQDDQKDKENKVDEKLQQEIKEALDFLADY